jgi:hypothetical protein
MKCNECKFCIKKRGCSSGTYECKRPVYSKFYNRPLYAYMDVQPSDECHYGGIEVYEKSENTTTRTAAS